MRRFYLLLPHGSQKWFSISRWFSCYLSCYVRSSWFLRDNFFVIRCGAWRWLFLDGLFLNEICWRIFIKFILNIIVPLHIIIHVQYLRELDAIIDFYSLECKIIEIKSSQNNIQKFRHFKKPDTSLSWNFFLARLTKI